MSHPGKYWHWFYHPEGIKTEYGDYLYGGEAIKIPGYGNYLQNSDQSFTHTMGAVFETHRADVSGRNLDFFLVGDRTSGDGHLDGSKNGVRIASQTQIEVMCSEKDFTFNVPNMYYPLRQHSLVARIRSTGDGLVYASLFFDGVEYAEQSGVNKSYSYNQWGGAAPGRDEHNRVGDCIVKMIWAANYEAPASACMAECNDPFNTLVPA